MNNKKIIFNWKMQGDLSFCKQFLEVLSINFKKNYNYIVCPPMTMLHKFSDINYVNESFFLGAQNCANVAELQNEINYTGEISITNLKQFNVSHCLVGHSERRRHFNESDDIILQKMDHLLHSGIIPIICVRKFFEDGDYIKDIIRSFICSVNNVDNIIIAYEPVGAIGTGVVDNLYSIEENIAQIKNFIAMLGLNFQKKIDIIYGGSVNASNVGEILKICDGVLVGKVSTDIQKLTELLNII